MEDDPNVLEGIGAFDEPYTVERNEKLPDVWRSSGS